MKYFYVLFLLCGSFLSAQNLPLYVGTFTTDTESKGIYYYDFNSETGQLTNRKLATEAVNPTFLTKSSDNNFLYAACRYDTENNLRSYSINQNGALILLNAVDTHGKGSCHVQLNAANDKAVVSNYVGGNFSVYNLNTDGTAQEAFQIVDNNIPTKEAHAHSAKFYKNELFVADLGRDFVSHYILNDEKYKLLKNYSMPEKAGPRHFEISKNGNFIYVINELNSAITTLKREAKTFTEIQTVSTLQNTFQGKNSCADIHLSKDEQFLYGSNRGENTIVVFKRNLDTGKLQKVQSISVEGNWPRNFTIDPTGSFLLVANRRSNNISVFKIAKTSGRLTYLYSTNTPAPVCLVF